MIEMLELDREVGRAEAEHATQTLEAGGLVIFPDLPFKLEAEEVRFLDPAILARSKNISLNPATGVVSGAQAGEQDQASLSHLLERFSARADALLGQTTPAYSGALQKRRTSFRPGAVAQRALSPRKDDRRLHVDAFPANPVQGRRILRVFANVNPVGQARLWDVGEDDFTHFVRHFAPRLKTPRGGGWLTQKLGLTKGRRTAYDNAMLKLHDLAKLDETYQATAPKRRVEFPPGSMWIVYTDSVLHAALAGQHAFEQTYLLPAEAMRSPNLAPVKILETLIGRPLV